MTPYEYVKFMRKGSTTKEKGIYLAGCTAESGDYIPRSIATVDHVKAVAEVLPLSSITIVKD